MIFQTLLMDLEVVSNCYMMYIFRVNRYYVTRYKLDLHMMRFDSFSERYGDPWWMYF